MWRFMDNGQCEEVDVNLLIGTWLDIKSEEEEEELDQIKKKEKELDWVSMVRRMIYKLYQQDSLLQPDSDKDGGQGDASSKRGLRGA